MEKNNIEEFKMILDLAANGGKMQAQNEMLLEKITHLEEDPKRGLRRDFCLSSNNKYC